MLDAGKDFSLTSNIQHPTSALSFLLFKAGAGIIRFVT
jgi:hypothetical protein